MTLFFQKTKTAPLYRHPMMKKLVNEICVLKNVIKIDDQSLPKFANEFKKVMYVPPIEVSHILKKKALIVMNGIVDRIVFTIDNTASGTMYCELSPSTKLFTTR